MSDSLELNQETCSNSSVFKYRLDILYNGANFYGWQKQVGHISVQEQIELVLKKIFSCFVPILGASRTDSGVSARSQVACFSLNKKIDCLKLKASLNALTPSSIYIKEVLPVDPSFHPIYNVKSKLYSYSFIFDRAKTPLQSGVLALSYSDKSFDLSAVSESLEYIVGTHNFKSFCASDSCVKDYTRTLYEIALVKDLNEETRYEIWFLGSGFLKQMIRSIIGTLFDIAHHKLKPSDLKDILEKQDRRQASFTASPEGLVLEYINYDSDYIKDPSNDKLSSKSILVQHLSYSKKIIRRVSCFDKSN